VVFLEITKKIYNASTIIDSDFRVILLHQMKIQNLVRCFCTKLKYLIIYSHMLRSIFKDIFQSNSFKYIWKKIKIIIFSFKNIKLNRIKLVTFTLFKLSDNSFIRKVVVNVWTSFSYGMV